MLPSNTRPLARRVLLSFMLTFITARLVSILMLLPQVPDIYLYVHDIHIHHLNYGIFLLAGVGAYLLFSTEPATAPNRRPPLPQRFTVSVSASHSTSSGCGCI